VGEQQYALLVDAGYLFAAAGRLVLATTTRRDFRVDTPGFVAALTEAAAERLPGRLLRVYWFDAAKDRVPTVEQRGVAQLPAVKLRLGNLNGAGQQKGVDAQVRADLETLARNHAVTDAILIAGDEDMLPAIEAAQAYGVRVHLWGVEPPFGSNQAERLVWEADQYHQLDEDFCRPFLHRAEPVRPVPRPGDLPRPPIPTPLASTSLAPTSLAPTPLTVAPLGLQVRLAPGAVPVQGAVPTVPVQGEGAVRPVPVAVPTQVRPVPLAPTLDLRRVEDIGESIAHRWLYQRGRENLGDLLPDAPRLPTVIDRDLLVEAEGELGTTLRGSEEARRKLRDGFWARLNREFPPESAGDDGRPPG
jgi:hypothetical protein